MKTLPLDLENKTGRPSEPFVLAPSRRANLRDPAGYQPDNDLINAIKVALLLRKPLLVTGEPGTGKTDLGRYLAWKMNYLFFQFDAKSNSVSRDLYYTYDSLGRFQAAQSGELPESRNFIRFNALGAAILESKPLEELSEPVRNLLPDRGHHHSGQRQSVVVIDEIDKTPRDFPNDLLNELDQNFFRIPELGIGRVEAKEGFEPILVITSNSEKNLPAPFVDAQNKLASWRKDFNDARPHSALADRTPSEFAALWKDKAISCSGERFTPNTSNTTQEKPHQGFAAPAYAALDPTSPEQAKQPNMGAKRQIESSPKQ